MKRANIYLIALASGLVLGTLGLQPAMASTNLDGIGVSRMGDSIVVIITTAAPCDYNVFLTDSKPERIVIDLSGVVNNLPQKQFLKLPLHSINSIRTSQFKSEPELQARVVLDIERPIDFRNYRNGNNVVVKFPAVADEVEFSRWESSGADPIDQPAVERPEKVEDNPESTTEKSVEIAESPAAKEPITPVQLSVSSASSVQGTPVDVTAKRATVEYTAGNLKDPFTPLIGIGKGKDSGSIPSLENLKLVGILEDTEINRALLEDAEGNGYILKPNDKVQSGYLVTVTENKAIFQVTEYGWTRTVALELEVPEIK